MLLNKYSIYLASLLLSQLTLYSDEVIANTFEHVDSEKRDAGSEDVLGEDFWFYMAEFADDEELLEPDVLINDSELNSSSVTLARDMKSSAISEVSTSSERSL